MLMEAQLLPYVESGINPAAGAVTFSVTEFHFLVLRGERIQALSSLNGALVQELGLLKADGTALGLSRDVIRDTTLLFTNKSLFQVRRSIPSCLGLLSTTTDLLNRSR